MTDHGRTRPAAAPAAGADAERHFGLDELFISITDAKGRIRLGNDVFVRVSGYPEAELVGRAHNVVRHPDMPRAVFSLMWEQLRAGHTFAGYVKNRAADGSHYWVMAVVVPSGGGYVSVRMKPTTAMLDAAKALYAELRRVEEDVEGGDVSRRKTAIAASRERMRQALAGLGFPSYDAFAHVALPAEVAARAAALAGSGSPVPAASAPDGLEAACAGARRSLATLTADLRGLTASAAALAERAASVTDLTDAIRIQSLNGLLAAARLADGQALAVIADLMRDSARRTGDMVGELATGMGRTVAEIGEMSFRMAAADLQIEMMLAFLRAHGGDRASAGAEVFLPLLAGAATSAVDGVCTALPELEGEMRDLAALATLLRREFSTARALVVNGRIEIARSGVLGHAEHFFSAVGEQVAASEQELRAFTQVESMLGLSESVAVRARSDATHLREAVVLATAA